MLVSWVAPVVAHPSPLSISEIPRATDRIDAPPARSELPEPWTPSWDLSIEGGTTLFDDGVGMFRAQSVALVGGRRLGRWSLGVTSGLDFWRAPLLSSDQVEQLGIWYVGPRAEIRFLRGRGRSALAGGLTVVIDPSSVDERAGGVGFFIDGRPLGVRFGLSKHCAFGVDPLGVRFMVADASGIPLVDVQFMTSMRLEGLF